MSRRTLTLTKRGYHPVTITPEHHGWTVRSGDGAVTVDAVQLEDRMEDWCLYGYREMPA